MRMSNTQTILEYLRKIVFRMKICYTKFCFEKYRKGIELIRNQFFVGAETEFSKSFSQINGLTT